MENEYFKTVYPKNFFLYTPTHNIEITVHVNLFNIFLMVIWILVFSKFIQVKLLKNYKYVSNISYFFSAYEYKYISECYENVSTRVHTCEPVTEYRGFDLIALHCESAQSGRVTSYR